MAFRMPTPAGANYHEINNDDSSAYAPIHAIVTDASGFPHYRHANQTSPRPLRNNFPGPMYRYTNIRNRWIANNRRRRSIRCFPGIHEMV